MSVECFVTGGSGFVGQHLLARLTAAGYKAWVLMRTPGNIERLRKQVGQLGGNPAYIHAVEGDISREGLGISEADKQCVSSASVIFHLAAEFSWGLSMERAQAVNVLRMRARTTRSFILLRCAATARVGTSWKGSLWFHSFEIWHKVGSKRSPAPPVTGCH